MVTTCVLCLEKIKHNDNKLKYTCPCKYDGVLHAECFIKWYKKKKKCIICLKPLKKKNIRINEKKIYCI